jgi:epsilon-lactone hydrolase
MYFKRLILMLMLNFSRSRFKFGSSIFSTRSNFKLYAKVIYLMISKPKDVQIEQVTMDGFTGMRFTPANKGPRIVMYIYGGAFVLGINDVKKGFIPFAAHLASISNTEIWVPDYGTAPEHAFPNQIDDCLASYKSLIKQGFNPQDITVMSNGSGAALALAMMFKLRDKSLPLPGSLITISAWTDLTLSSDSHVKLSDKDPMFASEAISGHFNHYLQGASPKDPMASPYFGNFTGFPPMYMMVGGRELFYDDTIRTAEKAREAGVNVTVDVEKDMMYSYPLVFEVMEEGRPAMERLAAFVKNTPPALEARPPHTTAVGS